MATKRKKSSMVEKIKRTVLGSTAGEAQVSLPYLATGNRLRRSFEVSLTVHQAFGLRMVFDGLQFADVELRSGKAVRNQQDALRYILEEIAESCPSP